MTEEQWIALVERLEPEARANPKAYGRKVALLGVLGYVALGLAVLALAALAVLVVVLALRSSGVLLKLAVPIVALIWVIARSLPVRMDPPDGVRLTKREAPELFAMLGEVRRAVRGPRIDEVRVDDQLNAAIVQIPRLAGLAGQRNYLLLGLPLMEALGPDEFRAVVAHELGHLSKNHGRFGAWVYRIRATWFQLLETLERERRAATFLFRRFFEWYVPYFSAYSFPLMRMHEFEADAAAAEAAGARPAATSLAKVAVSARYLHEEYWPSVFAQARDLPEPPPAFAGLRGAVAGAGGAAAARAWLQLELDRPPEPADTHPPLRERIAGLGFEPDGLLAEAARGNDGGRTAAEEYLGPAEPAVRDAVEWLWLREVRHAWQSMHGRARQAKQRRAALEEADREGELAPEELKELAALTLELGDEDAALPVCRRAAERSPGDAEAAWMLARLLLERGDDEGLEHVERAMEADPDAILPGCEAASAYLEARGRGDEAERFRARGAERLAVLQQAAAERDTVRESDVFLPHGLPDAALGSARDALSREGTVTSAHLVRREVEHLANEWPHFVLAVQERRGLRLSEDEDSPTLSERLAGAIELPGAFHVVVPGRRSGLFTRIREVAGSEIYRRG